MGFLELILRQLTAAWRTWAWDENFSDMKPPAALLPLQFQIPVYIYVCSVSSYLAILGMKFSDIWRGRLTELWRDTCRSWVYWWGVVPCYVARCRSESFQFIDYRCADKKKLASWEATLPPFDRSWLPLSENPDVHPPKNEPLGQQMHLKILHFSSGLKMSGAVEKLLFTNLWNRYHQQIPGINLIQICAISILLWQH